MSHEPSHTQRHSIQVGGIEIRYYLREPSPDQWTAVGVIYLDGTVEKFEERCPMVVGVGTTYHEAIGDLIARALDGSHPDLPRNVLEREAVAPVKQPTIADESPAWSLVACATAMEKSLAR